MANEAVWNDERTDGEQYEAWAERTISELRKQLKVAQQQRDALQASLTELLADIEDGQDITNSGGPNQAIRLLNDHGAAARAAIALVKAGAQ